MFLIFYLKETIILHSRDIKKNELKNNIDFIYREKQKVHGI